MTPVVLRRGDVYLIDPGPARGGEIREMRPRLFVSPDESNTHLQTHVIAPLTSGGHPYPFRVPCRFRGRRGHVVLDELRTVDRQRLSKRLGRLSPATLQQVLVVLQEMFAE